MPCTDTAVLVQFRSISVAVASAPATTVEGTKVKLVTSTVPVQVGWTIVRGAVNEPTLVPPTLRFTTASSRVAVHCAKVEKIMVWVAVPFGAMFDAWPTGSIAGQPVGIPATPGALNPPDQ